MLLFGALAAAALGSAIQRAAGVALARWQWRGGKQRAKQAFRDYVPHLTDKERQILGYLLEKNQKTFEAAHDGGYAATLLGRGFVTYLGVRGQTIDMNRTPMAVRDDVWEVMQEERSDFPYKPEYGSGRGARVETHPWRVPWGL